MNTGHALTCALLIPAGLAGIIAGVHNVLVAVDGLSGLLRIVAEFNERLAPWSEGLVCLFIGMLMLVAAAALAVRGLQS